MSLRQRVLGKFQLLLAVVTGLIQLPTVLWACSTTHSWLPALFAVGVSLPYVLQLKVPWASPAARLPTYSALGWWTACLAFDLLLLPVHWAVRAGAPASWAWGLAGLASVALGVDAVMGRPRVRRRVVRIPGLPDALRGYRVGQLSDIHCGPHASERSVVRWVNRLNALKLDLVTVTGDLIAHGDSHLEAVSRALGGLRARDGAWVSLGNHDYFGDVERLVRLLREKGITVLRNEGRVIVRRDAQLFVAGVDDTWTHRDDLDRALASRPPNAPVVLLAHDPDLWPQATRQGVDLTLSGHTHGGQLGIPGSRLSLARFVSRWTAGLYRNENSWLYVNRGAGTTGPPIRVGAPPELAVITLERG